MKCSNILRSLAFSLPLVLLIMLTRGEMPLYSQSNEQQSNSNEQHLQTWEQLSSQFEMSLDQQEQTLRQALLKITTLEKSGEVLNYLLKQSLEQNNSLKEYNQQISLRMQERDEDLAKAYAKLDKQATYGVIAIAITLVNIIILVVRIVL